MCVCVCVCVCVCAQPCVCVPERVCVSAWIIGCLPVIMNVRGRYAECSGMSRCHLICSVAMCHQCI